jgi:uncharacterized membrane protein
MTSDNAAGRPSTGRGLRLALMASLALNVLFIGAVGGTLIWSRHSGWRPHGRHGGLMAFTQTLPPERGEALRRKIESQEMVLEPLREAERQARDAARSALMTEPFDIEKFKAALERAADADSKERKARLAVFAETAAVLTPDERRQLHLWFERRRAHWHHPPPPPPNDPTPPTQE